MSTEVEMENGNGKDDALVPIVSMEIIGTELDVQITTAKRFPRSVKRFQSEAMELATLDEETAAGCFYVLERTDRKTNEVVRIEGPGVRLAEIISSCWTNLYCAERVVGESEDHRFIVGEGVVWDLERNVRKTVRTTRRITNKYGKRYGDDMIQVTGNAACAISGRNAIFKTIPKIYWWPVYLAAKDMAIGDAAQLTERRQKMIDHFAKLGVDRDRVLARIGKASLDDVDRADLEFLIGLSTALKDGDIDADVAFPPASGNLSEEKAAPQSLQDKIAAKAAETKKQSSAQPEIHEKREKNTGKQLGLRESREPGAEG